MTCPDTSPGTVLLKVDSTMSVRNPSFFKKGVTLDVVWFKRDLRIEDHLPLWRAAESGSVFCVFVLEDIYLNHPTTSPQHVSFLLETLGQLQAHLRALGGELHVLRGDVVEVFEHLHQTRGITRLWSHQETGLDSTYKRDLAVGKWARERDISWTEVRQHGVFRGLRDRDGWAALWHKEMAQPLVPVPANPAWADVEQAWTQLPVMEELQVMRYPEELRVHRAWESAEELLSSFLGERGQGYQKGMSAPEEAWHKCSRLSPHLALGTVSLKQVYKRLNERKVALKEEPRTPGRGEWGRSLYSFGKRLRWHCHFIQKLESEPELEFHAMHRHLRGLRPMPPDHSRLEAWSTGRTGYPMVDACMRSLNATGWINFRMRAMLVSFACYHLWLPWQLVAERLARKFLDYEPGIHICQIQMQSGVTGINTLRIYSPSKQLADQDPQGTFVRKWVPELEGIPVSQLCSQYPGRGDLLSPTSVDYPDPIVLHKEATSAARSAIWKIRARPESKEESTRVYARHGSRRRPDRPARKPRKKAAQAS